MSGIYITMEMPKKPIIIQIYPDGRVRHIDGNGYKSHADAIPVPDHGRLIDADALREDWLENGENEYVYDTNSFLDSIDYAPTIIPKEEGTGNE